MYRYIDVHSHIAFEAFDEDRDEVIASMREQGIATITIGADLKSSQEAVACAQKYDNVFATVGLHPDEAVSEDFDVAAFNELVSNPNVVGVGECGLDYYRIDPDATDTKERQKRIFKEQIDFAIRHDKPLMLHGRPVKGGMDAYEEMLSILSEARQLHGEKLRGNVHFFVGTPEVAARFAELNFTVSFTGVVTFSSDYDETVKSLAPEGLHAETDSPYATPVPHRGARNDPRYLPLIVARLAVLRGEDEEVVRLRLLENARRVFSIPRA